MTNRPVLEQLIELLDEGILDPSEVAKTALSWLSEQDLKRMAEVNEFFPYTYTDQDED